MGQRNSCEQDFIPFVKGVVGFATDNPAGEIVLKMFHSEIVNNQERVSEEGVAFKEIPVVSAGHTATGGRQFLPDKMDVKRLLQKEVEKLRNQSTFTEGLFCRICLQTSGKQNPGKAVGKTFIRRKALPGLFLSPFIQQSFILAPQKLKLPPIRFSSFPYLHHLCQQPQLTRPAFISPLFLPQQGLLRRPAYDSTVRHSVKRKNSAIVNVQRFAK